MHTTLITFCVPSARVPPAMRASSEIISTTSNHVREGLRESTAFQILPLIPGIRIPVGDTTSFQSMGLDPVVKVKWKHTQWLGASFGVRVSSGGVIGMRCEESTATDL